MQQSAAESAVKAIQGQIPKSAPSGSDLVDPRDRKSGETENEESEEKVVKRGLCTGNFDLQDVKVESNTFFASGINIYACFLTQKL
jgi:hypothetical protein